MRRDYLTDALGSVTGTVTSAGAIENTYRYKPYGAQLSKTGSGSDPMFLWMGKWGHRQTSKNYSEVYVKARSYSYTIGFWCSIDRINTTDKSRYTYKNPVNYVDYSGYIEVKPWKQNEKWILTQAKLMNSGRFGKGSACGSYDAYWTFTLDKPAPPDPKEAYKTVGYIVQKVEYRYPKNLLDPYPKANGFWTYWEAWEVREGKTVVRLNDPKDFDYKRSKFEYTDHAFHSGLSEGKGLFPGESGKIEQLGEIRYYTISETGDINAPGSGCIIDGNANNPGCRLFNTGERSWAGILKCRTSEPSFWAKAPQIPEVTQTRKAGAEFSCTGPMETWISTPFYNPMN